MEFEAIDFSKLEEKSASGRWGKDSALHDRQVFYDAEKRLFVKIWSEKFRFHRLLCCGREYKPQKTKSILGFDAGFYNSETACAFIDFIFDRSGNCRGYVTKHGVPLPTMNDPLVVEFCRRVIEATIATGLAHTDFCFNNLILVDGRISFIDFDTVLTNLHSASLEVERRIGGLRPHIYPAYREFLATEMAHGRRRTLHIAKEQEHHSRPASPGEDQSPAIASHEAAAVQQISESNDSMESPNNLERQFEETERLLQKERTLSQTLLKRAEKAERSFAEERLLTQDLSRRFEQIQTLLSTERAALKKLKRHTEQTGSLLEKERKTSEKLKHQVVQNERQLTEQRRLMEKMQKQIRDAETRLNELEQLKKHWWIILGRRVKLLRNSGK